MAPPPRLAHKRQATPPPVPHGHSGVTPTGARVGPRTPEIALRTARQPPLIRGGLGGGAPSNHRRPWAIRSLGAPAGPTALAPPPARPMGWHSRCGPLQARTPSSPPPWASLPLHRRAGGQIPAPRRSSTTLQMLRGRHQRVPPACRHPHPLSHRRCRVTCRLRLQVLVTQQCMPHRVPTPPQAVLVKHPRRTRPALAMAAAALPPLPNDAVSRLTGGPDPPAGLLQTGGSLIDTRGTVEYLAGEGGGRVVLVRRHQMASWRQAKRTGLPRQ